MGRRLHRLNALFRQELVALIRTKLRDPRLADVVSITRVDISPDLQNASVYASVLGDEEAKLSTLKALTAAAPFLRHHLSQRITLWRIPMFHFVLDETIEEAAHVLEIMKQMPKMQPPP